VPVAAVFLAASCGTADRTTELRLGVTTTIDDSGLLQVIDSAFKAAYPSYSLRIVTGGTGEILEIARRGDLDVTWTHDPIGEAEYVAAGHGVERIEIMRSDFVIAGPASDPAAVRGMSNAAEALAAIRRAGARFVSRGDDSGTHRKEQQLWRAVGIDPPDLERESWYVVSGVGMADALRLAGELGAYVLTDRPTLTLTGAALPLTILVEGDPRLVNRYGLIVQSQTPRHAIADAFVQFMNGDAEAIITNFGRGGAGPPLFRYGSITSD